MKSYEIEFCKQLAKGVARQFGSNCEVVVHDLCAENPEHSVVAIENGHEITIDGEALVGATSNRMDSALGRRRALAARGAI